MSDKLTARLVEFKNGQSRERASGQYGFTNNYDRLCVCGHRLGHHTAQAPHECIDGDFNPVDVPCGCMRFRLAKS